MAFYKENKLAWEELSPKFQALFLAINTQTTKARNDLDTEIQREEAAIDGIRDSIDKLKTDQFGIGGIKGQVVKYNTGTNDIFYADDHFFMIEEKMGTDPNVFYKYDMDAGIYYDSNNVKQELPLRSFLYEDSSERLWYYVKPGKWFKIKDRYVKITDTTTVYTNSNLLYSGFDTYDGFNRYYKIYDNGWCEQMGRYSHVKYGINGYSNYIEFAVPFKDTNYVVTVGAQITGANYPCTHGYATYTKYPEKMIFAICNYYTNHWNSSSYHVAGFIDLDKYKQDHGIKI